jgi:hypothetical protein
MFLLYYIFLHPIYSSSLITADRLLRDIPTAGSNIGLYDFNKMFTIVGSL